jgi:hypothetical protein
MACETLAEAFVQMNRYSRLVVEIDGVITSESTHGRVQTLRGIGPLEPRTAAD